VPELSKAPSPRTSVTAEDYLERIGALIRTKGYARVVDIATELGISQASVTSMVQRLGSEGLLKYEKYRGMVLTSSGEEVAARIAHRHELITRFLTLLDLPPEVVSHDVEGLEHHISEQTFEAMERLSAYLEAHPDVRKSLTAGVKP
jgi:Mn-dependent DtxR family transcriptional regulator